LGLNEPFRRSPPETVLSIEKARRIVVTVDVHAHAFPSAYTAVADRLGGGIPGIGKLPVDDSHDMENRFIRMADAGVLRQILSPSIAPYTRDSALGVDAARIVNDSYANACKVNPNRLSMWVSLPLPHIEASLHEIDRTFNLPGTVGVTLHCFCLGQSIASSNFDPIYEALNARAATVFLHPCQNGLCSPLINDWGLTVCVGASMEDSLAALHLIAAGIPARYPRIRFIVPHFGGILPMLLERLDGQMPKDKLTELPSITARRFYYDTVGWGSRSALLSAVNAFGAGQLVVGSDYPYLLNWESYTTTIDHIRRSGLSEAQVSTILNNGARLIAARQDDGRRNELPRTQSLLP